LVILVPLIPAVVATTAGFFFQSFERVRRHGLSRMRASDQRSFRQDGRGGMHRLDAMNFSKC